jgi:hypothetical protein
MATQEMRQAEYEAYRLLADAVADHDPRRAGDLARRMHAGGVARATQLQAAIPQPVIEFKGKRRRSGRSEPQTQPGI